MNRARIFALLLTLITLTAGFDCDPAQKKTVEQNVVTGVRATVKSVPASIDIMRSLREAGLVEASVNLELAQIALDVNSALQSFTKAALADADSKDLLDKLDVAVNLASELESKGTLHLKNGETKPVFQLGVIAAKNGLVIARNEFKASGGAGLSFTLNSETRKSLQELMPVFEKNDRLLREAITRLGGQP